METQKTSTPPSPPFDDPKNLPPNLPSNLPSNLIDLYTALLRTRMVENHIAYICHNQSPKDPLIVGKGYLSTGQEAVSVGAAWALKDGDWLAPSHRDLGAHLVRGITLRQVFSQYFCRKDSPTRGRDGNVHFGDISKNILSFVSHMGSWTVVANGVAAALQYRNQKNVVLTFFGDGASSQGVVHEAMNYAAVFKLPVVFVVNNNHYAISTPFHEQTAVPHLSARAAGYGMPGVTVDGNQVLDVYQAVQTAVDRARSGDGPSLVEADTMRIGGHGTHDPATYIPATTLEEWKKRDPIDRFENFLREKKLLTTEEAQRIHQTIELEIEEAVSFAKDQTKPRAEDLEENLR